MNGHKTSFIAIGLVNITKVEDLKIDLGDKEIYQLINDTNKVEYYYD